MLTLTGPPPHGDVDWSRHRSRVVHDLPRRYDITAADVISSDSEMTFRRCAAVTACPPRRPVSSAVVATCS